MFAEDVDLLPKGSFLGLLQTHRNDPATLQIMLRSLWADMDTGGFSIALAKKLLRFNGKLFKNSAADGYSLLLTLVQIDLLIQAAQTNWREVEPAIFGTLLERALDPVERHSMGAHFTPRAYVERLVLPTVIEPLRNEWADVQAAALVLAHEAALLDSKAHTAKMQEARAEVKKFHHRLCTLVVLDPACGSANFLYVTLEHLKRLEGEVLNQLEALGVAGAGFQDSLGFAGEAVTLQQLRGIELNERAAALAELVLWIGYLQWHIRTQGNAAVAEPVVHDYGNIECRDAVLAWDAQAPAYGADGELLTRWDGVTFKVHPVNSALVPDEAALIPQWTYTGVRQAVWPHADFLVGNPRRSTALQQIPLLRDLPLPLRRHRPHPRPANPNRPPGRTNRRAPQTGSKPAKPHQRPNPHRPVQRARSPQSWHRTEPQRENHQRARPGQRAQRAARRTRCGRATFVWRLRPERRAQHRRPPDPPRPPEPAAQH